MADQDSRRLRRSDNNGVNCDTCRVFGEIQRRLLNRFETEMMQIKTQLANMNADYHYKSDTTY